MYFLFIYTLLPLPFPKPAFASVYRIPEFENVVNNITDTAVWIIGTCLVLIILGLGVQFFLSSDSPQERAKLKSKIIWIIIGLFIVLSAKPLSVILQSII